MTRAFVALPVPDEAADRIAALQSVLRYGRPVERADLHLTLAFLGDQPDDALDELAWALSQLRAEAPDIRLTAPDLFAEGRALALAAEPSAALSDLHAAALRAARAAGITPERRRFRGHVTICRLPRGEEHRAAAMVPALLEAAVLPIRYTAAGLSLVSSTLHPGGARYDPVLTIPLEKNEGKA